MPEMAHDWLNKVFYSSILFYSTKNFNMIFESGRVSEIWTEECIVPIYKNKGEILNPDNYRSITILRYMGKLFTSVLNNKLNDYLSNYKILGEEQAGFRKQYGTCNHIFNPSHAAIKISINATAAEFICKNFFPYLCR